MLSGPICCSWWYRISEAMAVLCLQAASAQVPVQEEDAPLQELPPLPGQP